MNNNFEKLRELFDKARAVPPMQREAWLHAECDDENLRQDVVELLKYDDENSFFEKR